MRHVHALVFLTTALGLSLLNCSGDEGTLPETAGTGGTRSNTPSGAGMSHVGAGVGGTAPGAVPSSGGHASGSGGAPASTGGSAGAASGAPALGAGGLAGATTSGGAPSTGGQGPAGGAGAGAGGAAAGTPGGAGTGQAGAAAGASGSAGSAAVGPCGPVTGATFAQVEAIITKSCGTTECHPNSMKAHTDLHNTDGKLYDRLLAAAPNSVKKECQNRPLVVPCSPETSLVMQKLGTNEDAWAGCGAQMPFECPDKRQCLSAADTEIIRSWIAAGALR